MNERDKALLEAIEAVQVAELDYRLTMHPLADAPYCEDYKRHFANGILAAFRFSARAIAELRKEENRG